MELYLREGKYSGTWRNFPHPAVKSYHILEVKSFHASHNGDDSLLCNDGANFIWLDCAGFNYWPPHDYGDVSDNDYRVIVRMVDVDVYVQF